MKGSASGFFHLLLPVETLSHKINATRTQTRRLSQPLFVDIYSYITTKFMTCVVHPTLFCRLRCAQSQGA
jgi:hypothetical protein